ncbi:MAG: GGDEF domain-containing protein [Phycisphaerae bacterium]|nr:GGDEF domain-containing protein [Phycisphaerae bacterium]
MNFARLEKVLASPNLPSLPAVAIKVLELTNKPDVSLKQVAQVIEHDQAIAAKVLRTINSSFYGLSKRCASIQQALALLGLQTVKGLVLGFSLTKSMDGGGETEVSFDFLSYWRRSIYSAAAAKHLAVATRRCDPDEAFVAGLMQDIGMVALWRALGDQYLQTLDAAGANHLKLCPIERKAFELDHAAVSGEMARRWRFPECVAESLRCHHDSAKAPVEAMQLARIVELGTLAAIVITSPKRSDDLTNKFCTAAREWFDITASPALEMLQTMADLAQQLARVFNLNVGEKPDVDAIVARAQSIRDDQGLPGMDVDKIIEAEARDATDPLTGLADRAVFVRDLDMAMASTKQNTGVGSGLAVCVIALDGVRELNGRFGPLAGDTALQHVAPLVVEGLGRFGRAYRFVGAAFVALIPKADNEQLARIAESIRRRVGETVARLEGPNGPESVHLTVTCGTALSMNDPSNPTAATLNREQLVRSAMVALTNAQQQPPSAKAA